MAWRFGLGACDSETRACTSKIMGLDPSMITVSAEPGWAFVLEKKREDISFAETRPSAFISKTPISEVGPKRFLKPRRILNS